MLRMILAVAFAVFSTAASAATVAIDQGPLTGATDNGVDSYKGIPYASPPVGDLRWQAPQAAPRWTMPRDANAFGAACMQHATESMLLRANLPQSEDCLTLNVWTPAGANNLPVMVWIYGGGFTQGAAAVPLFNGAALARRGVVLVTFNYRVGRFGFFAHPALTKEAKGAPLGNYSFLDTIAAMKWVKRNAGAFGGDPNNVTVFGESAGGMAVHMLLTSPMTNGLFQRAIIESGGGRSGLIPMRGLKEAEPIGVAFAKSVGIEGDDAAALAALRKVPAEKVVAGLNMASMQAAAATYVGGPLLDGQILVESPEDAFRNGHNHKVPVIVGANSADIGFSFAKTLDEVFTPFGTEKDKARAAYNPDNSEDVRAVGSKVAMDRFMIEPARFIAKTMAAQGPKAYVFRFSYVAESMRKQWHGAPHATEIPYVFDTVAAKYGRELTASDEAAAKATILYWTNFAKSGDPNSPAAAPTPWPAYDAKTEGIIDFTNDGPKAGPDPWKSRLDLIEATAVRH
jgi:para-nitrobenzyl esterase